jgi:hypothetical protein
VDARFRVASVRIHLRIRTQTDTIPGANPKVEGGLNGYLLEDTTSTFDFATNTLVNTGPMFFSGTVLGSEPVILNGDHRFDVDFTTGNTMGEVHLRRSNDAPHKGFWYECDLVAVDAGFTPEGDPISDYTGTCIRRGR